MQSQSSNTAIQRLIISNVRILHQVCLEDLATINLLFGANGSGKTSVLEAIHCLSVAKSFRSHKLNPLINHDADSCTVFAEIYTDGVGIKTAGVARYRHRVPNVEIKLAGEKLHSVAQLTRHFPLQIINADSYDLLEGAPAIRRRFLDWGVFHVEHSFYSLWQKAHRCVKQRNRLLRLGSNKYSELELATWTDALVQASEALDRQRQQYFNQLIPAFQSCLSHLIKLEGIELTYHRGWDKKRTLAEVLSSQSVTEKAQGHTLSGPHRADWHCRYQGIDAAEVLSRGQQKLVVCALQLTQGQLLAKLTGKRCIFLIDDLAAELDAQHRQTLCELLAQLNTQVFITCIDHNDLTDCWPQTDLKLFHVEHGRVKCKTLTDR